MFGFTAFPCTSQKLPSSSGKCVFVSMFIFRLSFHTMSVHLPFPLVFRSPLLNFILCPRFFSIPFLFCLIVPQQFIVLVCKLLNNAEDEKKLSMYSLCYTCSILASSPVTVTCVAVMEGVTRFLSLPKYIVVLQVYSLESHIL